VAARPWTQYLSAGKIATWRSKMTLRAIASVRVHCEFQSGSAGEARSRASAAVVIQLGGVIAMVLAARSSPSGDATVPASRLICSVAGLRLGNVTRIWRVSARPPASRVRTAAPEIRGVPGRVTVAAGVEAPPTAAGRRWRSGGPGAAGWRRPAPARSTGRPGRDAAALGSSSQGSACRTGWCVPGRTGGHRPARPGPGRACRGRPTTATGP
jgi:hypothetical protein